MLFSPSTRGFYDREMHRNIPIDAVEITKDDHAALISGQSMGQQITPGHDGKPVLSAPPAPTNEDLAAHARSRRSALIAASDYTVMPDYPATPAKKAAFKAYRKALRDLPEQAGFPFEIDWPSKP